MRAGDARAVFACMRPKGLDRIEGDAELRCAPPVLTLSWWPRPAPRSTRGKRSWPAKSPPHSTIGCRASRVTRTPAATAARYSSRAAKFGVNRMRSGASETARGAPLRPVPRHALEGKAFAVERAGCRGADWPSVRSASGRPRRSCAGRAPARARWRGRRRSVAFPRSPARAVRACRAPPGRPRRRRFPAFDLAPARAEHPASSTRMAPARISSACRRGTRSSIRPSSTTKVRLRLFDDCEMRCTSSAPNSASTAESLCSIERMPRPTR